MDFLFSPLLIVAFRIPAPSSSERWCHGWTAARPILYATILSSQPTGEGRAWFLGAIWCMPWLGSRHPRPTVPVSVIFLYDMHEVTCGGFERPVSDGSPRSGDRLCHGWTAAPPTLYATTQSSQPLGEGRSTGPRAIWCMPRLGSRHPRAYRACMFHFSCGGFERPISDVFSPSRLKRGLPSREDRLRLEAFS